MSAIADATDSSTVKKLIQAVEGLQETVERQAERIDELEETVETQRRVFSSAIAAQAERIGELENELAQHKDHTGREIADVRSRITDLEEQNQETQPGSDDATPGVDAVKNRSQNTETPLERICAIPEHVADRELTANQERARFIARDVRDYAESAPAGLVIDSRAIKRVLTAVEGKRPHTQTVARVMDFLDDLGKEGVQQKKRRGKKFIVVDPEAADRLANHDRCDRGGGTTPGEDVIRPA
jgi:prefoldin subunit 5